MKTPQMIARQAAYLQAAPRVAVEGELRKEQPLRRIARPGPRNPQRLRRERPLKTRLEEAIGAAGRRVGELGRAVHLHLDFFLQDARRVLPVAEVDHAGIVRRHRSPRVQLAAKLVQVNLHAEVDFVRAQDDGHLPALAGDHPPDVRRRRIQRPGRRRRQPKLLRPAIDRQPHTDLPLRDRLHL